MRLPGPRPLPLRSRLLPLLAAMLLAPPAAADEERGTALVRDAQAAMAAGEHERAVELLRQARVEWPDAPLVANTLADALREQGDYAAALAEYLRGQEGGLEHHAQFNRAVTVHLHAELVLAQAGVPADAGALPEGPQPEMLAAIEQARAQLDRATDDFLQSLDTRPEPSARESIEALSRRAEALDTIAEELRRRQEDQQQQQQEQGQGDQQQEQDQDQDQDEQQQDEQQQEQQQQSEGEQEQPQDQPPQPQDQQDQAESDGEEQPSPPPQAGEPQGEPRELSPEEVQQLLDRLDQLEQQARELQKAREAGRRRPVEKDW